MLKNAIDNVFGSQAFRNKVAGFVGYSAGLVGGARAVEHLAHIAIEAELVPLRNAGARRPGAPGVRRRRAHGRGLRPRRCASCSMISSGGAKRLRAARQQGELRPLRPDASPRSIATWTARALDATRSGRVDRGVVLEVLHAASGEFVHFTGVRYQPPALSVPPSATMVWPTTHAAISLERNSTTAATSSPSP